MDAVASSRPGSRSSRTARGLLAVGLLAFVLAVLAANRDPATGYELSIYWSTTPLFWAGVGVAALVGVLVGFTARPWLRGIGVALVGASVFAVVALPVLRGYHYYGVADALTHLGWARQLSTGAAVPADMLYPGLHSIAVFVGALGGVSVRQGLLLATVAFPVGYVVFVTLTVRRLEPDRTAATVVGGLSALLFLSINHISMFFHAHTFSQATLFAALVVFALVVYVRRVDVDGLRALATGDGIVLSLACAATVLYHPQLAADLLAVFVAATVLQLFARWRTDGGGIAADASLAGPTAVFAAAYAAWVLPGGWFGGAVSRHAAPLLATLQGQPPAVGDRIASQSASLLAIGGSPIEIYLKLFVPATVYLLLAGAFVLAVADGRGRSWDATPTSTYLIVGAIVSGGFVLVYFVASVTEMYFRHLGVVLLFCTVLGALALVEATGPGPLPSARTVTGGLAVALLVLLALSGAVLHFSPWIYYANQHVTAQQATGYEGTFAAQDETYPVASVRGRAHRFHDSFYGPEATGPTARTTVDGEGLPQLRSTYADGAYVVIDEQAIQRETVAYRELRFTREQFAAVDRQPGVSRVRSTGESRTYFVAPATA